MAFRTGIDKSLMVSLMSPSRSLHILSFLSIIAPNYFRYVSTPAIGFIYLAYQLMALLYETVPAFEDTWIECLGDLGRYRMAIEDEEIRERET